MKSGYRVAYIPVPEGLAEKIETITSGESDHSDEKGEKQQNSLEVNHIIYWIMPFYYITYSFIF